MDTARPKQIEREGNTVNKREHLEPALRYDLRRCSDLNAKISLAREALEAVGTHFDGDTVEILLGEVSIAALRSTIETLPETANTAYLRALMRSREGTGASAEWEHFFQLQGGHDLYHLLAYMQELAQEGKFEAAVRQLQLALRARVPYAFFPRAQKVVEQLMSVRLPCLRSVRIAVLSSSTTSLLVPVLKALSLRDRIHAEFYQGPYGAIEQEVLDPESGLGSFHPDIVFLILHWRDLALPALSPDEEELTARVVEQRKAVWQHLSDRFGCHVVQHAFDFPTEEPHGYLGDSLPGGRSRVIGAINDRMKKAAPFFVSILDAPAVQREVGERWEDATQWCSFKQHPSTEALPALAELQQAHLRAVLGMTRKVLVTDLDNTLWQGVIGEDGLQGIEVGPGTALGEAYQRLQRYLLDLKARGILLAVCSKNNLEDARLPFERHEHMLLRLDDFTAFCANWEDKAQNLRAIAEKLALGLESFVFLDDSPMEREWVASQLPQISVVDLGPSAFHWVRNLDRGYHFFSLALSQEDLARSEQYRAESQREIVRANSRSLEEFLSQLHLEASVTPVSESNLARITQLINKTNQFNLTTKRYTEPQVLQFVSKPGTWTGAFELWDRLGSYGLIGVILCSPCPDVAEWEVDTWLMSCRALGRQLEQFMFDQMMEAAASRGVKRIRGVYRPTKKNLLVADLYERLGFHRVLENSEEAVYSIEVPAYPPITATHIQIRRGSAPPASQEQPVLTRT